MVSIQFARLSGETYLRDARDKHDEHFGIATSVFTPEVQMNDDSATQ